MSLQGSDHRSADEGYAGSICSISLEVDGDTRTRSMAKLRCGHEFHLDCICSAFDYTGKRQCLNCADMEEGYGQLINCGGTRHYSGSSQPESMMAEACHHGNGTQCSSSCLFRHCDSCTGGQSVTSNLRYPSNDQFQTSVYQHHQNNDSGAARGHF